MHIICSVLQSASELAVQFKVQSSNEQIAHACLHYDSAGMEVS